MLTGAWLGLRKEEGMDRRAPTPLRDFMLLSACIVLFYGIQFTAKTIVAIAPWQILSLLPLMGTFYYFYRLCNAPFFKVIMGHRSVRAIILTVAGLCLESYLIQSSLFTVSLNSIWPLNLLIITILILFCSYAVRCCARLLLQTFSSDDYDWNAVFRLY